MADAHLNGLVDREKFPDVEIAAFCDVVLERAQAQATKYDAVAFDSPKTMMAEAGLDAVYILLPPFAHGDAERAAIEAGVPFLVEKPIGLDLGVLRELRDEVQRKDLLAAAGYMNRYQPSVQRAKALLGNDKLVLAHGAWFGGPPLQKADGSPGSLIGQWWPVKERSGGQFHEQVTHTVDLARYFLGNATEVFAHATTAFNKTLPNLVEHYTMDDALIASIKFESGAVATLMASSATPVGGGIHLNILGMNSAVKFSGWGHDAVIQTRVNGETTEEQAASAGEIFAIEDRAFLDAVATGDRSKVLSTYVDAFQTAQITVAANQSVASGQPVPIEV
jgi:predicted dehydrogenase